VAIARYQRNNFVFLTMTLLTACSINIYYPAGGIPPAPDFTERTSAPAAKTNSDVADLLEMYLTSNGERKSVLADEESFELNVVTQVDAFLSCYFRQADGTIIRLYPSRYTGQGLVAKNTLTRIPKTENFTLISKAGRSAEAFLCLASRENVLPKLSAKLRNTDFSPLPVKDFDTLYRHYRQATNQSLIGRVESVMVR